MDNPDSVLLSRITGLLYPPGSTAPLDAMACLVHPLVAVVPRVAMNEKGPPGTDFLFHFVAAESDWHVPATYVASDAWLAAFLLATASPEPLAILLDLLSQRPPPPGSTINLLARDDSAAGLVPLSARYDGVTAHGLEGLDGRLRLTIQEPSSNAYLLGAPLVYGGKLIGIADTLAQSSGSKGELLYALPAELIRKSHAVAEAVSRVERTPVAGSSGGSYEAPGRVEGSAVQGEMETANVGEAPETIAVRRKAPAAAKKAPKKKPTARSRARGEAATPRIDQAAFLRRLSQGARHVLSHADGMRQAQGLDALHVEHLVGGIASMDGGVAQRMLGALELNRDGLRELLGKAARHEQPFPAPGGYAPSVLSDLPPSSAHAGYAFASAVAAADAEKSERIDVRHLLAGALGVEMCGVVDALRERGLTPEHVGARVPALRLFREPVGGTRYHADDPEGEDALGIEREVKALAAVLARKDTPLPLSLGLFGDWGSGKSFFMHALEDEIAALADEARGDPASPHHSGIVQLWFNAWHYIDTNLWASLAAAIFQGLAAELDRGEGDRRKREELKGRILAQTTHLEQVRADAQERRRRLDRDLRDEQARLERLEAEERTVQRSLTAGELLRASWRAVATHPTVESAVKEASEKLGIPQAKLAVADARAQVLEWGRVRRSAWGLGQALAERSRGRRAAILAGLVLGLAGLFLIFDLEVVPEVGNWLDRLPGIGSLAAGIAALAAGLATGTAALAPVLKAVRQAVGVLEKAKEENRARVAAEREERKKALLEHQERINHDKAEAEQQIDAATRELRELERQLAALHPERRMQDFVSERHASTDYTQHLGVIARARRDFEMLTERLDEVLEEERKAAEEAGEPAGARRAAISRIVLYIDDLDRCPEDKVVDVLQAVHLLLAFKLFVVVVGVDSRWLLHSLKQHSAVFRGRRAGADGEEGDELSVDERVHWQSTPLNYLEKIFQVPFTLRPMAETGFHELIESLANPEQVDGDRHKRELRERLRAASAELRRARADPQAAAAAQAREQATQQAVERGLGKIAVPGEAQEQQSENLLDRLDRILLQVEAEQPAAATREPERQQRATEAARLEIGAAEREFMKRTYRLIPTPRAAKRFLNVYRLVRGGLDADQLEALVGSPEAGEYRAVLLLLAMLTGYPAEATVVLRDLVETEPDDTWWHYLERLEQRRREAAEANDDAADPFAGLEGVEESRWADMLRKLEAVRPYLPAGQSCEDFVKWAPEIARYSFYSGRVLFGREPGDASSRPSRPSAPPGSAPPAEAAEAVQVAVGPPPAASPA
ncbi:MAG TPA: P-loop NTPase fold protein [Longimicrobium sp.]